MSSTTFTSTSTSTNTSTNTSTDTGTTAAASKPVRTPSWKAGLATGAVAAAAVLAVVGAFHAAGHPLGVEGEAIPVLGFVQMVLLGAVAGIVMARRMQPETFVRATVVLVALSCVPSVAWGTTAVDKAGLVFTHLVAAAIIVPRFARR